MINLYQRLSAACRTVNQLNKLHIALENRMTPVELVSLHKFLLPTNNVPKEQPPATATPAATRLMATQIDETAKNILQREWISGLHHKFLFAGKSTPMPFTRRKIHNGVYSYSSPGEKQFKTALVCFTGNAQRMMMPTPVFLQNVASSQTDVIYLCTRRGDGYRNGIVGLGSDFETSVHRLDLLLKPHGYGRVATVGTSAGGLPALLAGLQLGADAVLSVGAANPNDARWIPQGSNQKHSNLFDRFANYGSRHPDIYLVHGALYPPDISANEAIAAKIKTSETISVPDSSHVVLFDLLTRGLLGGLLKRTVLPPTSYATN